jgi:hypothetical protein
VPSSVISPFARPGQSPDLQMLGMHGPGYLGDPSTPSKGPKPPAPQEVSYGPITPAVGPIEKPATLPEPVATPVPQTAPAPAPVAAPPPAIAGLMSAAAPERSEGWDTKAGGSMSLGGLPGQRSASKALSALSRLTSVY